MRTLILNRDNISQYYSFYYIFYQINAALVNCRDSFEKHKKIWPIPYWPNFWTVLYITKKHIKVKVNRSQNICCHYSFLHFSCSLGFSNSLFFCGAVDSLISCLSIYLSSSGSARLLMVTFDGICSQRVIISALLWMQMHHWQETGKVRKNPIKLY